MLAPAYEHQIVCDNCGHVAWAHELEPEEFCRVGVETDPAMQTESPDGRTILNEGDLIGGEAGLSAEVVVTHVSNCAQCALSP